MKLSAAPKKPFPFLLTLLGLALAGVASFVGWNIYQQRYPSWYEEVRLSDGRIVTIHQKREYFNNYGTTQSWLTIDLPELGGKRTWHSRLMPQRVDVVDGKVYVFGVPRGILQNEYYQYPKHFIVAYYWNGNEFQRLPFLKIPSVIREQENVYPCEWMPRKGVLKIDRKDRQWCPERGDRWKFGKKIVLADYEALAIFYAGLAGGQPITD